MPVSRASFERNSPEPEQMSADRLFAGLDHRRIVTGSNRSAIEVISIHVSPTAGAWVQLEIAGQPRQAVILHLPESTTVDDAITALDEWGQMPLERRPQCIEVARWRN